MEGKGAFPDVAVTLFLVVFEMGNSPDLLEPNVGGFCLLGRVAM